METSSPTTANNTSPPLTMGSTFSKPKRNASQTSSPLTLSSTSSSSSSASSSAAWNPARIPRGPSPTAPPPTPQTANEQKGQPKIKPRSTLTKTTKLKKHSHQVGQTLHIRWPNATAWVDCHVLACDCERGLFVRYLDGFCEWIDLKDLRFRV